MDRTARKAASSAWKDRPADAGIYAFRDAQGGVWVGASPTLGAIENRLRFSLRSGGATDPALAAAWAAAGGEGFVFEVLERLDPDLVPLARTDALKARVAHWRAVLDARAL
ncbi:MAG: GIY-YIG nuclease family protein [Rhodobacteraceae bacterium]|nr:GIY-YIG nuclease family protein [Paracoccaceae bacterium]